MMIRRFFGSVFFRVEKYFSAIKKSAGEGRGCVEFYEIILFMHQKRGWIESENRLAEPRIMLDRGTGRADFHADEC
jgi:hypothetical protein